MEIVSILSIGNCLKYSGLRLALCAAYLITRTHYCSRIPILKGGLPRGVWFGMFILVELIIGNGVCLSFYIKRYVFPSKILPRVDLTVFEFFFTFSVLYKLMKAFYIEIRFVREFLFLRFVYNEEIF